MTVARLPNPPARYSWSVVLPHPRDRGRRSSAPALNASEQMFFFGAPLAHVVQYEEHLRAGRQERAFRRHRLPERQRLG